MRGFDIETYRQIFGPEIGSILHEYRFSYMPRRSKNGLEDWQAGKAKPENYRKLRSLLTFRPKLISWKYWGRGFAHFLVFP